MTHKIRVDCELEISVWVGCPNKECQDYFNLFALKHLNDDGYLCKELLSNTGFGKENWNKTIRCPECGCTFYIGNVYW